MKADSFREFVLDQLHGLDRLREKRMFGAYGLYAGEIFFGILDAGRLYFKIDESTVGRYLEYSMGPLVVSEKQTLKSFYEVPVDILEDHEQLLAWAHEAIAVQHRLSGL